MFAPGATKLSSSAFTKAGRGTLIPIMEAVVELPELMVSSKGRVARVINRAIREALKKEMLFHHKRRIPEHFNRFRQRKYGYQKRSERVERIKGRRSQADLVKSGRTKREMTKTMSIRFPRTGQAGVSILGTLRWPPGFRLNRSALKGITAEVMADEISRWTSREERVAASHVRDNFVEFLEQNLSRRAKLKIKDQLTAIGVRV
jgi:hypothetical protein